MVSECENLTHSVFSRFSSTLLYKFLAFSLILMLIIYFAAFRVGQLLVQLDVRIFVNVRDE